MTVMLDGQLLSPADGCLIRKGPGNCHFDFAQQIVFGACEHDSLSQRPWLTTHSL